jgi:hypothetical protein
MQAKLHMPSLWTKLQEWDEQVCMCNFSLLSEAVWTAGFEVIRTIVPLAQCEKVAIGCGMIGESCAAV